MCWTKEFSGLVLEQIEPGLTMDLISFRGAETARATPHLTPPGVAWDIDCERAIGLNRHNKALQRTRKDRAAELRRYAFAGVAGWPDY